MLAGLKIETIFVRLFGTGREKNQIRITHTHVHIRGLELVEVMGHPLKFASFLRAPQTRSDWRARRLCVCCVSSLCRNISSCLHPTISPYLQ
jgi:hypothetical protein